MSFNKIYVLGAGAIGSIYGALLSKKNDVTLIGNKAHMDAVNSKGLSISGDINETFYLKADTEICEIPENTLIILTTKAYDSTKAIEETKKLLKKDTVALILQNGLGNEEIVKRVAGDKAKILRAITTMATEFFEPGKIRFWSGETIIEQNEVAKRIAEIINGCKLKTRLSDDINREVWNKLVVNCVVNPLSALFQVRNCELVSDSLKTVRHGIVRECVKVGKAEGITFPKDLEERVDEKISNYTNFSSMYQDVMKGKKTEIDFLNGKVVELGRKHSIPTPVNETLVCLIKFMEEKNGISRKN
ncbi:MAG: ketopantoate reductase family protein [Candidatus Bathyarchaeota archaeon]|nr:ketopantoate reductase family protein [Candidatus Bathyarchaeota archaeon]